MAFKKEFVCENCGAKYPKWVGMCHNCGVWNSINEVNVDTSKNVLNPAAVALLKVDLKPISEIENNQEHIRYKSGIDEFDRVAGGGLVKGSVVLIGGEPGIGKSTLLLQISSNLSNNANCLYFSGEESVSQIKLRYDRIKHNASNFKLAASNSLDAIIESVKEELKGRDDVVVVIDSIQTLTNLSNDSFAGSITQIKTSTQVLIDFAKKNNVTVIIVGHVTKDGNIAGPKLLEHMVDAVFYLEGEKINNYRLLRAIKNRYGSSDEIGVFEMRADGLAEMKNPSELFINRRKFDIPGVVTFASIEGSRAMMLEIQSLLVDTNFPAPRRSVVGIELNRLYVILAVLEAICKVSFQKKDVYVSVVGGIKISDPAVDFAVAASLLSSYRRQPINSSNVIFGELGLTGEIRNVTQAGLRVREASKLGFNSAITSKKLEDDFDNLTTFWNIRDFYQEFFG